MAVRLTVRDSDSGNEVMVDVEDETVVEEVVESVAKYWDKPTGAYVVRRGKEILTGSALFKDLNPTKEDLLELIPDPEGG